MAVARLAYEHLATANPHALGRMVAILKNHPHYQEFLARHRPQGVEEGEWVFLRAATWPDWVRPAKKGDPPRPARITRYHRADDHFIDLPIVRPGDQGYFADLDLGPDQETNTALGALAQRVGELRSDYTSEADKAVALCWLLHLVGDVHQPLHCATLFSREFRTGDAGGNAIPVKAGDDLTHLHTYWDDLLGSIPGSFEDTPARAAKVYLGAKEAAAQLHDARYARDRLAELLRQHGRPRSWVRESFELAKAVAYRDGGRFLVGPGSGGGELHHQPVRLSDDYAYTAKAVARERIALAGYRLADKLPGWLTKPKP
jgi:hypothetical protein